jgi:hypothetical protein
MKPAYWGLAALGLLAGTFGAPTAWAQTTPSHETHAIMAQDGASERGGPATAQQPTAAQPAATRGRARLAAERDPFIRGEALIRQAAGNLTGVVVTVYGLEPGSTHLAHIHNGSCTGAILFPLHNLVADRSGTARTTTPVPAGINFDTWWVNVHASYELPSPGITCGKVEAPPAPPARQESERPRSGDGDRPATSEPPPSPGAGR